MKTEVLKLRIGEEELGEWKKKAEAASLTMSGWVRQKCNADENSNPDVPRVPDDSVLERGAVGDGGFFGKPAYQEHPRSCQCGVCGFAREAGLK